MAAYIKETGDYEILDEPVPFDCKKGTEEPLFEHLNRSFQFTVTHLGPHRLPLIGRADWNDCLNLNCFSSELGEPFQTTGPSEGSVAESVFIAAMFVKYGREFAEICRCTDREKLAAEAEKALDSVQKHLETKYGIMLLQPAYTRYHLELGEITSYPPGYKENAGIFCHNNPWISIAETMIGRGDRAFEIYRKICPSCIEEISDIHRTEPYVYSQMVAGADAPRFGEAKNSWLTGTAAWTFVNLFVTEHYPVMERLVDQIMRIRGIITPVLLFVFTMMIYKFLPNHIVQLRIQLMGAAFSAVGWMIVSWIFSVYLDIFKGFSSMYGSLTTIVLIMLWLYFCMYILLLGGEVNMILRDMEQG